MDKVIGYLFQIFSIDSNFKKVGKEERESACGGLLVKFVHPIRNRCPKN